MTSNLFFKGFDYFSQDDGAYENDDSLSPLYEINAGAMGLGWGVDPQDDMVYAGSIFTGPLVGEFAAIDQAVGEGLSPTATPTIDAPPAAGGTLNLTFKGFDYVSYYNGAYENDDSLPALAQTGANSIETSLDWGIDPQNDTVYADSIFTDALTAEAAVIRQAVSLGLSVMVKPHIDFEESADMTGTPYVVGDWRTYFNPGAAGSAGANTFFASYKTMIVAEATNAASAGATSFCIGTELDQICGPAYLSYWTAIISAIRAAAPNLKLTYAADWNDAFSPWTPHNSGVANGLSAGTGNLATQISFASQLDYFGIDCYAPLADSLTPTLQQLIDGWTQAPVDSGATAGTFDVTGNQSLISYFEGVSAAVGKPIIFTEIGYENATDAAESPFGSSTKAEDDNLQARLYQAFFQSWQQAGNSSLVGAYLYNWDPNASEVGPGNVAFSPQGLPALAIVKQYFAAVTVAAPTTIFSGLQVPVAVPGLVLSSSDTTGAITAKLTAGEGDLLASANLAGGGGTITGDDTGTLTIVGTLAQVNADLTTLKYVAAHAANDTIAVATSDAGVTGDSASIAATYDPNFPDVQFSSLSQISSTMLEFNGTVNSAIDGRTVTLLVNGAGAATGTATSSGTWLAVATLSTSAVQEVTAEATDAAGHTGVTAPLMVAMAGGLTANFSAVNGDVAELLNAATDADTVNGSNGYIIVYGSAATINGGDDNIYTDGHATDKVTLAETDGQADYVQGDDATVTLQGAQATISGGGVSVVFASGAGNAAALTTTGSDWDGVTASGGTISLSSASASISGGGDSITFVGSGDAASLYSTGGAWDGIAGSNGAIYETSASASITGGGDSINLLGSGDAVSLYDTGSAWDGVNATKGVIYETSASASVAGGGNSITMLGSGDAASLYTTGSAWDGINATSGVIYETSASASVAGGGNSITMLGSGDAASLYSTAGKWDGVNGSNGTIYETNATASVSGGGDSITMIGSGDAASLYATGAAADNVSGSNGSLYLTNASASLAGSGDAVTLAGSDTLAFGKAIGINAISGFASTDVIRFSSADFASWSALQPDIAQSGANTTIKLDANDVLTLLNVTASSLTQGEFKFA